MKKTIGSVLLIALCASCSHQRYVVTDIKAERYQLVAKDYQGQVPEMTYMIQKYKQVLDQEMNKVIGQSDQYMTIGQPESLLTNLTSDVMQLYGEKLTGGNCDLASMNVHGHRADLPKGNITVGNIFEIYSFDNKLVLIKMKGSDLLKAFESYAKLGGAGISSTAKLVIKDGKLVSATVKGQPVDPQKVYTVITLDYLADGNDGMEAFKDAQELVDPNLILRDVMMEYVQQQTAQGKIITSQLDGRIEIQP